MAREVCFLIGPDETILWSDASDSPTALPDSRERWEAIWSRRDRIVEIAHSHPEHDAIFSEEDESTMRALTSALGRAPRFSVVSMDRMLVRDGGRDCFLNPEPWWAALLRLASGMAPAARVEIASSETDTEKER